MLTQLCLTNFKNFRSVTVPLGAFTVIVGANASGKSNLRDAFRFLHGIARGYALAEVIGAKYGEGGELQWRGLRGGTKELAYAGESRLGLKATLKINGKDLPIRYPSLSLDIALNTSDGESPRIVLEQLRESYDGIYDTHPSGIAIGHNKHQLWAQLRRQNTRGKRPQFAFINNCAIFTQVASTRQLRGGDLSTVEQIRDELVSMRFLDLNPEKMRLPSFPGQVVLGDQGENLSSVLQAICEDDKRKASLLEWVRELTPMDAVDFEFPPDQIGRVLLTLVEADGRRTSAYSASDGTLRFLSMAAALLGPEPAKLYFFEEIDNGIHPTRLHLLLQLIERTVKDGQTQVVATTHSPDLLGLLSAHTLKASLLVYRLPHKSDSRVKRIVQLPDAERLIREQSAGRLHASGWLEDAVAFTEGGEE